MGHALKNVRQIVPTAIANLFCYSRLQADCLTALLTRSLLCLLLLPAALHAKEYCSGLPLQEKLECWDKLFNGKESEMQKALAASRRQVQATGASFGLDVKAMLTRMDASQRSWVLYREKECTLQRDLVGNGTDRDPQEMQCQLEKLDARILEIQRNWPR